MIRKLAYVLAAAVVLAGLAWWVGRSAMRSGRFGPVEEIADSDTPTARAIRLVGVQPDASDDILDADGRKVGQMFALISPHERGRWTGSRMHRTFLFELPRTREPVVLHGGLDIRVSGEIRGLGGSRRTHQIDHDGRRLLACEAVIARTFWEYGLLSRHRIPVERVDLTMRFYDGPPRENVVSFAGPFRPGTTVREIEGGSCTLTIPPQTRGTQPSFIVDTTRRLGMQTAPVLLYDLEGKRHVARLNIQRSGPRGTSCTCRLDPLTWDRVARIVVGEVPQVRRFRNVRVSYADRPTRQYAEYYHRMAERLGRPVTDVAQHCPADADEAIQVVDLVRGHALTRTAGRLRSVKFADLPAEKQEHLRQGAGGWAKAPLADVRAEAIMLGLKWQAGQEFATAALDLLAGRDGQADHAAHSRVAYALRRYPRLTPPQLDRVKRMLLDKNDPLIVQSLMYCLERSDSPAIDALRELAGAERRHVWLWWPAVARLRHQKQYPDRAALPRELRLRVALTDEAGTADAALADEARRTLPTLLTPELLRMNPTLFTTIYDRMKRTLDRATVTKAVIDLLRAPQDRDRPHWATERLVKQINLWFAKDFGSLGWNVRRQTTDSTKRDWTAIAAEVVRWYDAGGARSAATAAAVTRPAEPAGKAFGPVIERTLDLPAAGQPVFIDLDTGKLHSPASQKLVRTAKDQADWGRQTGADARVTILASRAELCCWDAVISPIPNAFWASAPPVLIDRVLSGANDRDRVASTAAFGRPPATFLFRTREGGVGLLQIVDSDAPARRARIRLRLRRK